MNHDADARQGRGRSLIAVPERPAEAGTGDQDRLLNSSAVFERDLERGLPAELRQGLREA
jgi:hypothetical protein